MTDDELDAIEARADVATPGPWRWADWMVTFGEMESDDFNNRRWLEANDSGDAPRLVSREIDPELILTVEDPIEHEGNRVFLAHARADVPALIAEIRRLRAGIAAALED